MPTNTLNADLLPGEALTLVGPGKVEFQATQAANVAATARNGKGIAVTKGVTGANVKGSIAGVNVKSGLAGVASKGTTAAANAGGTIWTGKGLSLGLGLGLGAWGPTILVAAVAGGYLYYRKRKASSFWPPWKF